MWNSSGLPARFKMPAHLFSCALLLMLPLLISHTSHAADILYKDIAALSDLNWQSGASIPSPGSADALNGGSFTAAIHSFPPNLRRIGRQTPHSFTSLLNKLQLPLAAVTQDGQLIAMLASRWAADSENRRLYFEINPLARWSDGTAVTTSDIAFSMQFIAAPHTHAEWQARQLNNLVKQTEIYSNQIFAFVLRKDTDAESALPTLAGLRPFARHAYENINDWPERFDWRPEPVTGPYMISQINAGESVVLQKVSDWWGYPAQPYFSNRFSVSRIILRYTASDELELFSRGEISAIDLPAATLWNSPAVTRLADEMKIRRYRLYNQAPATTNGLLINGRIAQLASPENRAAVADALNLPAATGEERERLKGIVAGHQPAEPPKPATAADHPPAQLVLSYSDVADEDLLLQLRQQAATNGLQIRLRKLPPGVLADKLALGEYELIWLSLAQPLNLDSLLSLFSRTQGALYIADPGIKDWILNQVEDPHRAARLIEEELINNYLFLPGYRFPYAQAAAWQWLHLPEPPGTRQSRSLFDPFDPLTGGLFWVNRRERAEIMAQPVRGQYGEAPPVIDTGFQVPKGDL